MSAFGRKNGPAGAKPGFGVARPMQGGAAVKEEAPRGGDQFPPLDIASLPAEAPLDPLSAPTSQMQRNADAMSRLSERANAEHVPDAGPQGFEASVHKIKEQVLPRLLERVDPEAAATLTKLVAGLAVFKLGLGAARIAFGGFLGPAANFIAFARKVGLVGKIFMGLRTAALFLALAIKVGALSAIPPIWVCAALPVAHCVSRFSAVCVIATSRYVREEGTGKPVATGISASSLIIAGFTALGAVAVGAVLFPFVSLLSGIVSLCFAHVLMRLFFEPKLGGYTGDTLGAVQQASEIGFYLGLLAWL